MQPSVKCPCVLLIHFLKLSDSLKHLGLAYTGHLHELLKKIESLCWQLCITWGSRPIPFPPGGEKSHRNGVLFLLFITNDDGGDGDGGDDGGDGDNDDKFESRVRS